ncbi:MAG: response regulator transcription factor, partial [Actinobacteria bacterium]|nr:response regulator transcription factor [Actinomycetota bacterium]
AALLGVCAGEAAIPRVMVAHLLEAFQQREPRWRRTAASAGDGQRLTSREWEVLELLAQGRSTAEIARTLAISPSAVRVHLASVVRKLNVADRAAAARLFRRRRATRSGRRSET